MRSSKPRGQRVKPLSLTKIRAVSNGARELLRLQTPYIDVINLYEVELHKRGVTYHYVTPEELPFEEAKTLPNDGVILIRESVYEQALAGNGRARFTFCHELGHLILHQGQDLQLARSSTPGSWGFHEDSEWQADAFAAELMMPVEMVGTLCRSVDDIMRIFGVSRSAATFRHQKLREEGIICW